MPRWNSNDGKWDPQNEKIGLINHSSGTITIGGKDVGPGEPFIYEGPCRAALFELFEAKEEHFGKDFQHDPDFISRVKGLGFNSMKDYLKFTGYSKEKSEKTFKENSSNVSRHELPEQVRMIRTASGGDDTSGSGKDQKGNFGAAPLL